MTIDKSKAEGIYQQATLLELGNNPQGTRHEVVLKAIELALQEGWTLAMESKSENI